MNIIKTTIQPVSLIAISHNFNSVETVPIVLTWANMTVETSYRNGFSDRSGTQNHPINFDVNIGEWLCCMLKRVGG